MHLLLPSYGVLSHFLPGLDRLEALFINFGDLAEPEPLHRRHSQRKLLSEIVLLPHITELEKSKSLPTLLRYTLQRDLIEGLLVLRSSDDRPLRERLPDEFDQVFLDPVLVYAYDA